VGDDELHERLVSRVCPWPEFIALTPHEDHYVHHLEDEVDMLWRLGPRGGLPAELRRSGLTIIRFDGSYSEEELVSICQEAEDIWQEEESDRRPRPPPPLMDVVPRFPLRQKTAPERSGRDVPPLPLAPREQAGAATRVDDGPGDAWVLAEPSGSHKIGIDVGDLMGPEAVRRGSHGLIELDGRWVRVERMDVAEVAGWAARRTEELRTALGINDLGTPRGSPRVTPRADGEGPAGAVEDARVLPVKRDELGTRRRIFSEAVRLYTEQEFSDWGLTGPRTVMWCHRELCKDGAGPRMRHERWKELNN
jgi:hypothetical protein